MFLRYIIFVKPLHIEYLKIVKRKVADHSRPFKNNKTDQTYTKPLKEY